MCAADEDRGESSEPRADDKAKLDMFAAAAQARFDALKPLMTAISKLRAEVFEHPDDQDARARLQAALVRARDEDDALRTAVEAAEHALDLPEGLLDALEEAKRAKARERPDHTQRASVAAERVSPNGFVDQHVPAALEKFERLLPRDWLSRESAKAWRLEGDYLTEPFSLVRGRRLGSERRDVHRFAQHLLVARDFADGHLGYDMFAGALLVPQLVALDRALDVLQAARGDVTERIRRLWDRSSALVDATAYELLVAAACIGHGRDVEFLAEGQRKTPDLRIHDLVVPVVVECKRRPMVLSVDIDEDDAIRLIFVKLRAQFLQRGMAGLVSLRLRVPLGSLNSDAVVQAAVQQRLAPDPRRAIHHEWGSIEYHQRSRRIRLPQTRLYSPAFLSDVFGWNNDVPTHDGIVCQVRATDSVMVDEARDAVGIAWIDESEAGFRRRARTAAALFAQALNQMPAGDLGVVYIAYPEGDRVAVADDRTQFVQKQLQEWEHAGHIRVPATVLTRLISRPLGGGAPDLIETGLQFYSGLYGAPEWFEDFPSLVFTPSE